MADQIIHKKQKSLLHAAPTQTTVQKDTRYISQATKNQVWQRDGGQCTFVEPLTKRRCTARHALQYDHKLPFGFGGANTSENIRLLCPAHNRLGAVEVFGNQTMKDFLPSLK